MKEQMPIRVKRSRKKGSKLPENTVCVNRGTIWGNPFKIVPNKDKAFSIEVEDELYLLVLFNNVDYLPAYKTKADAAKVAKRCYRDIVLGAKKSDGASRELGWVDSLVDLIKLRLKGKNLACFCDLSHDCHADVLLEIANEL